MPRNIPVETVAKYLSYLVYFIFLVLKGNISYRSSNCPANHFAFVNLANGEHDCWPCLSCPHGYGSSIPCGSLISEKTLVQCISCEFGVTFSSSFDQSACQTCSKCKPNETVVRLCMPTTDVICLRCEPNQITWISSKKETYEYECFDCPICSSGFEPSHPCGSTVPYGVLITCVQCREGETFSTMTDREQCKRCSPCPPGQRLIARCTKYFDTKCGHISSTRCGGNQIEWLHKTKLITCIDCPMCPAGMELSVPCGAVVASQYIKLFCVSCQPGLTYSDQQHQYECKVCSMCSPGAVLISKCSVHQNTLCSTNSSCSSNQITISSRSTVTCVDCIECSVGKEPSIPCGSLVTSGSWPRQQCTSCKPGTFSDSYGTEPCKHCQICNDGMMMKRHCSQVSNTVCLSCEAKHYFDHELSSCAPCSRCCKDERDIYPRECAHLESRKCKYRICLSNSKVSSTRKVTFNAVLTTRSTIPKSDFMLLMLMSLIFFTITVSAIVLIWLQFRRKRKKQFWTRIEERTSKRWRDVAG